MNGLKVFSNSEFGEVRVSTDAQGNPWFVGKDVAEVLGYERTTKAIKDHVDEEDIDEVPIQDSIGRMQNTPIINESGLYSLVLGSKLESAKRFKKWVTSEVLPSIRQNGGYIANQENLTPEQVVANALIVAQSIIANKDRLISEMKPKAEFFDAVAGSKTAIPMGDVAKVLGYGKGRNNLFRFLRDEKVLMQDNRPYQRYVDMGYFRVVEQKYTKPSGEVAISIKTLVYQKGVSFIGKLLERSFVNAKSQA